MARQATATKVHEHANAISSPSRDDFAAMLEASFETQSPQEGAVITGTVVAIENDFAVVDVGLKTEGRVSLKEFSMPGVPPSINVGDQVEVYLERVENALGEAVLSRDKARREESWIKLERAFNAEFGVGPSDYYRRIRMQRARDLLEHSTMPVREIGLAWVVTLPVCAGIGAAMAVLEQALERVVA